MTERMLISTAQDANAQGGSVFSRARGLYKPEFEHDACGIGFVADIKGRKSREIIDDGLKILANLEHRGAVGADPLSGDGAGMLIQMPHELFSEEAARLGFTLPESGQYGVGQLFMPKDAEWRAKCVAIVEKVLTDEGLTVLGWRDVPVNNEKLPESVTATEPVHQQVFIGRGPGLEDEDAFERRLYLARRVASNAITEAWGGSRLEDDFGYYSVSMSSRTIIYKGMFLSFQLSEYYQDLRDPRVKSALALVHQRFSTNTFPSWKLAHPYRMVAHNGEINTLRGNVNWMAARQASVSTPLFGDDISKLWPISNEGQSDTACFDNALEFLVAGGYSLAHAMMMLIPEAWAGNPLMDKKRRAFYEYHAALMEPWDGPASVAFTDGRQIGATLDRNGLRPARYFVTADDKIVLASEMGVLPYPEDQIVHKWRLQPGKMLLIDLQEGRIISDEEIKANLAGAYPYQKWLDSGQLSLQDLPSHSPAHTTPDVSLLDLQQTFGYTEESWKFIMGPMAETGQEAIGSMGTDTPVSALSDKSKLLHTYFKQNFAQVTNPPIDPIREELVMSLVSFIGPRPNILDLEGTLTQKRLVVHQPILTNDQMARLRSLDGIHEAAFRSITLDITYTADLGPAGMKTALEALSDMAERAVRDGYNIIILSDRFTSASRIPIPSLLATSAVHHDLIRKGLRTSVGLVVETGEAYEVHQFCTLAGYGAEAINPYLAFEIIEDKFANDPAPEAKEKAVKRYIKAIDKGILKVMSKMGISTYQSYCGAQIFDAVGLRSDFIAQYFTGTHTQVEGVGLKEIAKETYDRHRRAFSDVPSLRYALEAGGDYAVRQRGETHVWRSETISTLQHAVRMNVPEKFREFSKTINDQSEQLMTLRGLFRVKSAEEIGRTPIPLEEVEPATEIVKRFATGAMSYGSISREAHTTLAIAMNRIGGKSNTGEGGEEPDRFKPLPNGDTMRSAIKQVASGRFGVTTEYLANSDMIQIKMVQGAKPGEGGQLPGHKVNATIAKVRHSTPGVGLISPPPHHDIYSIEDLAQLIFDLKNVNPAADISVKLGSEVGVGTVAAGVAKARADHVTIAGYEGGTGASPLTSIKHAGSPWEIGLAETQQTLVANRLRGRIAVQVDGGVRTGRDILVGALLGADEFGFATAPLITVGCLMMRKCHLNTCPVGVALDFANLFFKPEAPAEVATSHTEQQNHPIDDILDRKLIGEAQAALENTMPLKLDLPICNVDRTTGAMLSGEIAKRYGHDGLPEDTIWITLHGTAGQSFGTWLAHGVTLDLVGDANDYVGKGLSGGRIIVRPAPEAKIVPEESIIVGNTVLYGAISGECYFRGVAGERFAVRNSGAVAVVEGTGDHGCEYMTGGVVVVLGKTGRNFAAGMSGGIAYVLDEDGDFERYCNMAMVDLEPIPAEEERMANIGHQSGDLHSHGVVDIMRDMSRFDAVRLRQLIENHRHYTGSERAKTILDNWETYMPKFVKVMPVEYRKALEKMAHEQAADTTGLDVIEIGLRHGR
ncbi:MAG: glutamate synthase large subunit [Alphaproteobacteria bacterium]